MQFNIQAKPRSPLARLDQDSTAHGSLSGSVLSSAPFNEDPANRAVDGLPPVHCSVSNCDLLNNLSVFPKAALSPLLIDERFLGMSLVE